MTTSFIGALLLASLLTSTGTTGTAATTKDTINMERKTSEASWLSILNRSQ